VLSERADLTNLFGFVLSERADLTNLFGFVPSERADLTNLFRFVPSEHADLTNPPERGHEGCSLLGRRSRIRSPLPRHLAFPGGFVASGRWYAARYARPR
jgi:hypothetical protein